MSQTNVIYI